jgi:hypothetical protein
VCVCVCARACLRACVPVHVCEHVRKHCVCARARAWSVRALRDGSVSVRGTMKERHVLGVDQDRQVQTPSPKPQAPSPRHRTFKQRHVIGVDQNENVIRPNRTHDKDSEQIEDSEVSDLKDFAIDEPGQREAQVDLPIYRLQGSGSRFSGSGFRGHGSGFGVRGSATVRGSGFGVRQDTEQDRKLHIPHLTPQNSTRHTPHSTRHNPHPIQLTVHTPHPRERREDLIEADDSNPKGVGADPYVKEDQGVGHVDEEQVLMKNTIQSKTSNTS